MKRIVQVAALTGLTTLVAGWLAAAPAGAATPTQVFHTQINGPLTNPINQCGFTVDSVVKGTVTYQTFVDASGNISIQDESHAVSILTNTANGKVVYVEQSDRDRYQPNGVVNPDGAITFTDTLTGMIARVYTSHSSILFKAVGFLNIVATFDAQGDLLSQQVIEHGPVGSDPAAFCGAIASAIG